MVNASVAAARKFPFLPVDHEQGWLPYMWLVYLANFVVPVAFWHASARDWWLTAGTLAIFLPLYFRSYWEQGWRQFALSAAMCVLGLCWAPWNPGSSVFIVYGVAAVVHDDDQRAAWRRYRDPDRGHGTRELVPAPAHVVLDPSHGILALRGRVDCGIA